MGEGCLIGTAHCGGCGCPSSSFRNVQNALRRLWQVAVEGSLTSRLRLRKRFGERPILRLRWTEPLKKASAIFYWPCFIPPTHSPTTHPLTNPMYQPVHPPSHLPPHVHFAIPNPPAPHDHTNHTHPYTQKHPPSPTHISHTNHIALHHGGMVLHRLMRADDRNRFVHGKLPSQASNLPPPRHLISLARLCAGFQTCY